MPQRSIEGRQRLYMRDGSFGSEVACATQARVRLLNDGMEMPKGGIAEEPAKEVVVIEPGDIEVRNHPCLVQSLRRAFQGISIESSLENSI